MSPTSQAAASRRGHAAATFDSLDPATGEVVGTHPVHTEEEVRAAVDSARTEAAWWADLGFTVRKRHLTAWKAALVQRLPELIETVHRETGKPVGDATLEAGLAIEHIGWAAGHARRVLGRRKVSPGLLMVNQSASVAYKPLGVIGVIGPWNYPVFTPLGSIAYALAAAMPWSSSPASTRRGWACGSPSDSRRPWAVRSSRSSPASVPPAPHRGHRLRRPRLRGVRRRTADLGAPTCVAMGRQAECDPDASPLAPVGGTGTGRVPWRCASGLSGLARSMWRGAAPRRRSWCPLRARCGRWWRQAAPAGGRGSSG